VPLTAKGALKSCKKDWQKESLPIRITASQNQIPKRRLKMEFSTEAVKKMAEIMVNEMEQNEAGEGGIRAVETGMREFLREVGAEALGRYLERKDEQMRN
jgi:hypothetical protein